MEIAIKINKQAVSVEVSYEVYEYLEESKRKTENLAHQKRMHWDEREFDEYIIATECRHIYSPTPEEILCHREIMYKDMDGTITVELQRFVNGRWTSYKTASESFEGNGVKMLNKEWSISSGRYRCHTKVEIMNANGDVVETQTFDCDAQDY